MLKQKFVSQTIPLDTLKQVEENLQAIDSLLKDYLITLTKADRISISGTTMGNRSFGFVTKALEHAKLQTHLVPAYLDVTAWGNMINFAAQLQTLQILLATIEEKVSDSRLAARHESYQGALLFYGGLKEQSRGNVGVAKVIRSELQQKFRNKKQPLSDKTTSTQ